MNKSSDHYSGSRTVTNRPNTYYQGIERNHSASPEREDSSSDSPLALATELLLGAVLSDSPEDKERNAYSGGNSSADSSGNGEGAVFSISGDSAAINGKKFNDLNNINLSVGGYLDEFNRLEFLVGYGQTAASLDSYLADSLDGNINLLTYGFSYKRYMTPRHTFLGQYFLFGMAMNDMYWTYKNAITAADGETITSDSISGLELFAGLGFNLAQTKNLHIGGEIVPSMISWERHTRHGFENDVFDTFWMTKFRVVFSFISGK
ncbi:MAG: hypothetical protein OEV42_10755 [Deltaproteobacteria bacterium]|nr:hypothetical protein [Deltaproteobacteria bacterium]